MFLLGPSHHFYLQGCALSRCTHYDTPLGALPLDTLIVEELAQSGLFKDMTLEQDEQEHSLEMHLPFIRHCFPNVQLVPILVGQLDLVLNTSSFNKDGLVDGGGPNGPEKSGKPSGPEKSGEQGQTLEQAYSQVLRPWLQRSDCFFVISSDFCHWGPRFRYTPPSDGPIHEFIKDLDHRGMRLIQENDLEGFKTYLKTTENTICGRNPICLLLAMTRSLACQIKFVAYAQSSQVIRPNDHSVSYASARVVLE